MLVIPRKIFWTTAVKWSALIWGLSEAFISRPVPSSLALSAMLKGKNSNLFSDNFSERYLPRILVHWYRSLERNRGLFFICESIDIWDLFWTRINDHVACIFMNKKFNKLRNFFREKIKYKISTYRAFAISKKFQSFYVPHRVDRVFWEVNSWDSNLSPISVRKWIVVT